jgi:hypothetical protein
MSEQNETKETEQHEAEQMEVGKATKGSKALSLVGLLGRPTIHPGGKLGKRQIGYGASKKDHPEGGTAGKVAFVSYKSQVPGWNPSGYIWTERYQENGQMVEDLKITLSFLSDPKGSPVKNSIPAETEAELHNAIYKAYDAYIAKSGGSAPSVTSTDSAARRRVLAAASK